MTDRLPLYCPTSKCPKCGCTEESRTEYWRGLQVMVRYCRRCGATWRERPLDHGDGGAALAMATTERQRQFAAQVRFGREAQIPLIEGYLRLMRMLDLDEVPADRKWALLRQELEGDRAYLQAALEKEKQP